MQNEVDDHLYKNDRWGKTRGGVKNSVMLWALALFLLGLAIGWRFFR